jgi:hypothetical protein
MFAPVKYRNFLIPSIVPVGGRSILKNNRVDASLCAVLCDRSWLLTLTCFFLLGRCETTKNIAVCRFAGFYRHDLLFLGFLMVVFSFSLFLRSILARCYVL